MTKFDDCPICGGERNIIEHAMGAYATKSMLVCSRCLCIRDVEGAKHNEPDEVGRVKRERGI